MSLTRNSYPRDVQDAECKFLVPYLTLMGEDASQRDYSPRDVLDAVRDVVNTGRQWDFYLMISRLGRLCISSGLTQTAANR